MESSKQEIILKDYQRKILDELAPLSSVGLFLGTGSGKTYMGLFKALENKTSNLLVICPARSVTQWEESVQNVMPDIEIVRFPKTGGSSSKNAILEGVEFSNHAVIVSLDSVAKIPALYHIVNHSWTVIVDESHRIKDFKTKVSNAVTRIGTKTNYKLILTATPTEKDFGGYIDYYTQLYFLGYLKMGVYEFMERYCVQQTFNFPSVPYPVKKIVGYKGTDELDTLLSKISRRYVPNFIDGEPEYTLVVVDKPKSYDYLAKQLKNVDLDVLNSSSRRIAKKYLTSGVGVEFDFSEGSTRKYIDNTVKLDWIKGFLEDTGETIVIFYKYNIELSMLSDLCEKLNRTYIVLNGENQNKSSSIRRDDYTVVLAQFRAAGEALDGLQYKSHIILYYSMPESSLEYTQSLGRINRVGQEKLPMYYHLVMTDTIDEIIYFMVKNKIHFTEDTLNSISVNELSTDDFIKKMQSENRIPQFVEQSFDL